MLDQLQSLGVTPLIGASAITAITLIFSLWDKTSGVLTKLFSFIIVPINLISDDSITENAFVTFVNNKMVASKINIDRFFLSTYLIKSKKIFEVVLCKLIPRGTSLYWYGKVPILIFNPGRQEPGPGSGNSKDNNFGFKYIRWTLNKKNFLKDILDYYNKEYIQREPNFIFITTFTGSSYSGEKNTNSEPTKKDFNSKDFRRYQTFPYGHEELSSEVRSIEESVYLSENLKNTIKEIKNWAALKDWYHSKCIPWKRSYLLTGKPGTGKTLFVRTAAESILADIYIFDLSTMNNEEFRKFWLQTNTNNAKVILLEDIDAVFNGRENITSTAMNKGLTFDCLLQAIDGIERGDGTLLFITTNYPEKLDAAISGGNATPGDITTRPGRVDRVIEFKELELEGSQVIVNNILGDSGLSKEELDNLIQSGIGKTPGQLQEICTRIALDRKWNNI